MNPAEDRSQRIERLMVERFATRKDAERFADEEIRREELYAHALLAVAQSGSSK